MWAEEGEASQTEDQGPRDQDHHCGEDDEGKVEPERHRPVVPREEALRVAKVGHHFAELGLHGAKEGVEWVEGPRHRQGIQLQGVRPLAVADLARGVERVERVEQHGDAPALRVVLLTHVIDHLLDVVVHLLLEVLHDLLQAAARRDAEALLQPRQHALGIVVVAVVVAAAALRSVARVAERVDLQGLRLAVLGQAAE